MVRQDFMPLQYIQMWSKNDNLTYRSAVFFNLTKKKTTSDRAHEGPAMRKWYPWLGTVMKITLSEVKLVQHQVA